MLIMFLILKIKKITFLTLKVKVFKIKTNNFLIRIIIKILEKVKILKKL
jgi:hypothetical protein